MPSIRCKDVGVDCPFEAEADTEAELMEKVAKHAKEAHGMETVPPDMEEKIKKAIRK